MFDTSRHNAVFKADSFSFPVHVIGCGGMGSRVAEGLVRLGLGIPGKNPITLYDKDQFEDHNLANQWVTTGRLGKKKVLAVKELMLEVNPNAQISTVSRNVTQKEYSFAGIVFICVDNMQARRSIVDRLMANRPSVRCVIETRMDAGVGISHCFDPNNQKQIACWRMYWHSDEEAQNMQGCGGAQSVISAIYATTALALKQLESFARIRSTHGLANRVYFDFDSHHVRTESW
jgi:molybdopterin/thiamine biosynthesis adenylyltransferase